MLDTLFIYLANDTELLKLLEKFRKDDSLHFSHSNAIYLSHAEDEYRRRGLHLSFVGEGI